jgi:endonuclease/exonuclease/phosphatase family metal-dependent hydrolase
MLEVSALDCDSEPVPLVISDTQQAVPNLCVYLHGLIGRGAASMKLERGEFVEVALTHLGAAAASARLTS